MLREYFPYSNAGAELYNGFLKDSGLFCRYFTISDSFSSTISPINLFLTQNGYAPFTENEVKLDLNYENGPLKLSTVGNGREVLLQISREPTSKSQAEFLINELVKFRDDRDWAQFHNPKDLAIAISIEANELLENFLWKTPEGANNEKVKEELADVFAYAFLMANHYGFNIEEILLNKIKSNSIKYPADKARGNAKKYTEF